MKEETIRGEIEDILKTLREMQKRVEKQHDEFQVALSGSLRLITTDKLETIERMHGSKEELKGYLIRKHLQLREEALANYRELEQRISSIRNTTQNQ